MAQASPDIRAMRRPVVSCSHAPGSLSRAGLGWLWLLRRRPWGCLLAGAIPTTMTLAGLSIVSDTLFENLNDSKMSLGAAPLLVVVTLVGPALTVAYPRNLRPEAEPADA
jgi:hypothetical protein